MTTRWLVTIPYLLLLFIGLVLPSDGKHGLLNPKSITFILTTLTITISFFFQSHITPRVWNLLLFFLSSIAFLIIWFMIGMSSRMLPLEIQLDQMKLFLITLSFPIMTAYLIEYDYITTTTFYRAVIYSSFVYIFLKCSIVLLHFVGVLDLKNFLDLTGFRSMDMDITEDISRLQTSVDIFTPFIVFFVLQSDRLKIPISTTFKTCYLILALASTFLSFSRYLIFIYLMSFLLYWFTLNAKKTILNIIFGFVVLIGSIIAIGPSKVQKIVELRVLSRNTTASDTTRKLQINALLNEFYQSPYLGKGLGAYVSTNIRDPILKHSYEVQWMAFLMQFGIFGLSLILIPLVLIAFQILNIPHCPAKYAFLILYLLWLASGFTNPFLISLGSGILYTCFYLLYPYCAKSVPSPKIALRPK